MTQYELLLKIGDFTCCSGAHDLALRAVVKLHKPKTVFSVYGKKYTICAMCDGFEYPCPTLYIIDEELK